MDEHTWLSCREPHEMLRWLWASWTASDRRYRLFACAAVRQFWPQLRAEQRRAVEVTEQYADELASQDELEATRTPQFQLMTGVRTDVDEAVACLGDTWGEDAARWVAGTMARAAVLSHGGDINTANADLLRDLFGPLPFRPVAFDPAWRTPTVRALAERAYLERQLPAGTLDASLLRVLADALEEAGCNQPDMLWHLRQHGAGHVRGCWCVDLLLEKD